MRILFLGTGTSHGVPVIGCHCPVCTSSNPHDRRMRSSILIEDGDTAVVIDTGCEFRLQALGAGITHLDGVLYTHAHADHLMGLDDLRVFSSSGRFPIYGFQSVLDSISRIFPYAFQTLPYKGAPQLERNTVGEGEQFSVGSIVFTAIPVMHGMMRIAGYRFGSAAYLTDVSDILWDENRERLEGVRTLIIGALRDRPHWSHFTFQQAAEAARTIGAEKVYFTHINHETSYSDIQRRFAPYAESAYDGLEIEVD